MLTTLGTEPLGTAPCRRRTLNGAPRAEGLKGWFEKGCFTDPKTGLVDGFSFDGDRTKVSLNSSRFRPYMADGVVYCGPRRFGRGGPKIPST